MDLKSNWRIFISFALNATSHLKKYISFRILYWWLIFKKWHISILFVWNILNIIFMSDFYSKVFLSDFFCKVGAINVKPLLLTFRCSVLKKCSSNLSHHFFLFRIKTVMNWTAKYWFPSHRILLSLSGNKKKNRFV